MSRLIRLCLLGLPGLLLLPALFASNAFPPPAAASRATPTALPFPPLTGGTLEHHDRAKLASQQAPQALDAVFDQPCINGFAAQFPCSNVDLLAFLPLAEIGGGMASSSWGWTDPDTHREYALLGRSTGTSFVDVTDPKHPVYLGNLPTATGESSWRELKTYGYYALIVSDANGKHGMQLFDLRQLRDAVHPPVTFGESAHYAGFGNGHTITVNADSGYAYINGTNTCNGGPHMVNVSDPLHPKFAGCFSGDGYTHDSQCVTYHGPDTRYTAHEICFNANEDTVNVLDVSNKKSPVPLARRSYLDYGYVHQGWLTPDHAYFMSDDEFDERDYAHTAYSYIWDVRALDQPKLIGTYHARFRAIDHNQYIRGDRIYQANYRAGLRVLDASNIATAKLREVGFFDIYPADDSPEFNGAWNVYPFHSNGIVTISGIEQGLFIVRLQPEPNPPPCPNKPGRPAPEAPDNGASQSKKRVHLGWAANACASSFKLVVRENNVRGKVVDRKAELTGTGYTTVKLSRHKTYWWRLSACNAWGCSKGEARTFKVE